MQATPRISVILPVHNAEPYLATSVESILAQTFGDFELLIVNDGSQDGSADTIHRLARADKRIQVITNEKNLGLIATLNKALTIARGEFIARQDADDVSVPGRFERQIDFLQKNPQVGLVGSAMQIINEAGTPAETYRQPETDSSIRFRLLFNNALIHTSVVFRRDLVGRHGLTYDSRFRHVEDFELWTRFLNVTEAYNFQEALVQYRVLSSSVSQRNQAEQAQRADEISANQLRSLDPKLCFPWETKGLMLHVFMKFLWGNLTDFAPEERNVLPALRSTVQLALCRFPKPDSRLTQFAERLDHELPSARKSFFRQLFSFSQKP